MVDHLHDQNHEDLGFLQEYVEMVRGDAPPEEWCQASRRQLQDSLESPREESWIMKLMSHKREGRLRWALALPLAALVILAVVIGIPGLRGGNSNAAFARVVQQIRTALTLVYTLVNRNPNTPAGMQDMKTEVSYKEPGLMRLSMGGMAVSVVDITKKRGVSINPNAKEFTETDFKNLTPEKANMVSREIDLLRNIPYKASEDLGTKNENGRVLHGYRVKNENQDMSAWLDADTGSLVTVEVDLSKMMPGAKAIMTDFKFNVPLDDSLFSMEMPKGYTRSHMEIDASISDEQRLIDLFKLWGKELGQGVFPPSLNPMEFGKAMGEGYAKAHGGKVNMEEFHKKQKNITMTLTFAVMVPAKMKPENDWHYEGKGIKFGDAGQPVCWWKPTGSKTYKVILGDLSVIDVDLGQAPTGNKISLPPKR
jgi:outer membrane lipoprotein-sorting protein